MTNQERIEYAEKRIKELQLLIRSWKEVTEENLPSWEKKLQGDGSGFTDITDTKSDWYGHW